MLNSFERQAENGLRTKLPSRKYVILLRRVECVSGQPNSTGISDIATLGLSPFFEWCSKKPRPEEMVG